MRDSRIELTSDAAVRLDRDLGEYMSFKVYICILGGQLTSLGGGIAAGERRCDQLLAELEDKRVPKMSENCVGWESGNCGVKGNID